MNANANSEPVQSSPKSAVAPVLSLEAKRSARKKAKDEGRTKRAQKLKTDKDFAKVFFEGKSKRSADRKSAFRKKKTRKK